MFKITWHNEEVPKELKITQVYGLVFDENGRFLLRVENKKGKQVYLLAGGTPEEFDENAFATMKREFIEEVNTEICDEIEYVGYQLVEGDGDRAPYAQVRMTAIIKNIGEKQPDPDNGETYDRVLVSPKKAIDLLGWGEVAQLQIESATKIAKEKFNLSIYEGDEEFWI